MRNWAITRGRLAALGVAQQRHESAMTRGSQTNEAFVYQHITGEADHQHTTPTTTPDIHTLRRGNTYSAARHLRQILAHDDRRRTMHDEAERIARHRLPDTIGRPPRPTSLDYRRGLPPIEIAVVIGQALRTSALLADGGGLSDHGILDDADALDLDSYPLTGSQACVGAAVEAFAVSLGRRISLIRCGGTAEREVRHLICVRGERNRPNSSAAVGAKDCQSCCA